ncbi:hypothetical protein [Pseudomonas vlassakiae]|uniref:Uncharacterized protein n=1 Tax=Pseudomonas vlassakiae TaxID=485888 RepID=A0A923GP49_9PSED|nr:hypothetical protein [Pseudomonas vlassakiae]MBV4543979.1 hypothetical protein [Pseudomonas vlassakiae]
MQNTRQTYDQASKQASKYYNGLSILISSIFLTVSACTSPPQANLTETSSEAKNARLNDAYQRLIIEHPEFNWQFVEGLAK